MSEFADCVPWDLIYNEEKRKLISTFIPASDSTYIPSSISPEYLAVGCIYIESSSGISSNSTISNLFGEVDGHKLKKIKEKEECEGTKQGRCAVCNRRAMWFCAHPMS